MMMFPSIYGDDLFDDWFDGFPFNDRSMRNAEKKLYGRHGDQIMKTDVKETETGYELAIDLPGFHKEDLQCSLENGYLTISASKSYENDPKEKKNEKYLRKERYEGACSRSFYVGDGITQEDIQASFHDGILTLTIPKKEQEQVEQNKYIAIEG